MCTENPHRLIREHRIVCTIGIVYVSENIFNIEEESFFFTKEVAMELLSTLLEICTVHCRPTVAHNMVNIAYSFIKL